MHQKPGKNQAYPAIAVILVLAVFGTFVFSAAGIMHGFETEGSKPYSSNSIYSSVNGTFDWLTTGIKTAGRPGRASFFPLQNALQRELVFFEKSYANECLTVLAVHSASTNHFLNTSDTILLKLRI